MVKYEESVKLNIKSYIHRHTQHVSFSMFKTLVSHYNRNLCTVQFEFNHPYISFSTNKTDRHNIAEIFLKVALNIMKQN
jgi:hypothetical protein